MSTATNDRGVPYVVAIVAMGPSHRDYMDECLAKSGRFQVADETWAINAMAGVIDHDRAIIMDDLAYFRKAARENKSLVGYSDWLDRLPGPVYTSRVDLDICPGSVEYPIDAVVADLGFAYFNNTTAYAIALAIHMRVKQIRLYGMDFTQDDRVMAEKGRACVEYWVATAIARGIKVYIAGSSSLCDQASGRTLYGYSIQP